MVSYRLFGISVALRIIRVFRGNDPLPLFLFFSVELTIAIIATRSLVGSKVVNSYNFHLR